MEGRRFTWFQKFTATAEKVPEELRGEFLWAVVQYGTYGEEPVLDWPLDAVFASVREDIDHSIRAIANGERGGRGHRKGAFDDAKDPFSTTRKGGLHDAKDPFIESERPLYDTSKGGFEGAKPITEHNSTEHNSTEHTHKRFAKPDVEQVKEYATGYGMPEFDAQGFVDYYESNGWKVGRNPMKDWKAAVRNWVRKDKPKGGLYAEYD